MAPLSMKWGHFFVRYAITDGCAPGLGRLKESAAG
jgi:hypothetical protein